MAPGHVLLAGPFRGLEPRFLEEVGRRLRGAPLEPVEVLAGSNLLSVYLRRRVAETLGAAVNLRFVTFLDLAREMAPRADPRPPLPALGAARLARRALAETPEAEAFGALRGRDALARALLSTHADLREAGLAGPFREALRSASPLPDRRAHLQALGAALDRLAALLGAFADPEALLERAAREGTSRAREPLLVYGVWDLGGTRARLLARLAATRRVEAWVPEGEEPERQRDPKRGAPLFEELLGVAARRERVEEGEPETVAVLAPSETAQAREVVRELLRAVERGTPLHRCAVLLRHPLRQEPAIVAELRLRGLSFFRPAGRGAARRPAARAAIALARLAGEDVPRGTFDEAADLLDSLGALPEGISTPRLARLLRGWFGGREALERRLARALRGAHTVSAHSDPEEGARRRARAVREAEAARAFCARLLSALPPASPASWVEQGARLEESLEKLLGRAARELSPACDAISSLEVVEPEAAIPFADVTALLPEALDLTPLPHGRFENDGVALLSLVSARGLLFDEVLVPGLDEGSFPAPPRPDPLLFDSERRVLREVTGAPLADRGGRRHLSGERFLFDVARGAARRRLVALAPTRDESDRERLPSPFLLSLPALAEAGADELRDVERAAARGVRRVPLGRLRPDPVALDEEEAFRFALLRRSALARAPLAPAPVAVALARARARFSPRFTAYEGRLGRRTDLLALDQRVLSASLLEGLATCAYRSLLERGLRIAGRDEAAAPLVPDKRELGGLAHEVLRALTADLVAHGRSFTFRPDALDAAAEAAAREAIARWAEEAGADPPPVLLAQAARRLFRIVSAALEHERGRRARPSGAEVRFGPAPGEGPDGELSRAEAVTLEADRRVLLLRGQIDRVDLEAGRARVVDYKFGGSAPYGVANKGRRLLAGGERVQLPVYALAAKALGAREVTSEYLFVPAHRPKASLISFDAEETEEAVALLSKAAALLLEAAERGDFFPKPDSARYGDSCATCGVAAVCGGGHAVIYRRKWNEDGGGAPLAELRTIR